MEIDRVLFVFTLCISLLYCVKPSPLNALKKPKFVEPTAAPFKDAEWNGKCRATTDCGSFGYVCARNKTCQCAKHYIVNYKIKLCLGGIDQQCHYDEHCIANAYCMNQATCQCKDKWPIPSIDGLECSNKSPRSRHVTIIFIISISIFFLLKT